MPFQIFYNVKINVNTHFTLSLPQVSLVSQKLGADDIYHINHSKKGFLTGDSLKCTFLG